MKRCTRCHMPDTRPGSIFKDGVCQACRNYDNRQNIDWTARWAELKALCDKYRRTSGYDVLIPVSGGKDSYQLVKIMVEDMGMHPLLVTVTDSFRHTQAGSWNLRNLLTRYNLNHWQYTISHDLFRRATRAAFEGTGEALKFVEYAIYTVPWNLAAALRIDLVVFGENSAYEYGSTTIDSFDANPAIYAMGAALDKARDWWRSCGVTDAEIDSIKPTELRIPQVIYMSYFKPWSSVDHLADAQKRGFKTLDDTKEWKRQGTVEQYEQMDSVAYMVHLWLKYPKFGFQRAMDIASRRCREGLMPLEEVRRIAKEVDPKLDPWALQDFCETMGYTESEFWAIAKKFDKMGVL